MSSRQPLRLAIAEAERMLATAGCASPRVDAELLASYVVGIERTKLMMTPLVDADVVEQLRHLAERRARREPLQHIMGSAPFGPIEVAVGEGVFIPRPETELMLEWGLGRISDVEAPVVVDLCAGTGALALAVAACRPDAVVHAVEADPIALTWTRRNAAAQAALGRTPIAVHAADVRWPDLLVELDAHVDLVLCNPPYVPDGTPVPPEVADWDPPGAVFGGPDGLEIVRAVVTAAAAMLRYGAVLAIEHDDTHGEAVPALLRRRKVLTEVQDHLDLAGRPRFATARRAEPG